jgi:hypothetical protein
MVGHLQLYKFLNKKDIMPGFLLHDSASVSCLHGGIATPSAPNPRVLVNGLPTVMVTVPHKITGCPFNVSGAPSPCITGQWISASQRVFSGPNALVLLDSQAKCVPNGTPLIITGTQTRVSSL